MSGGGFRSKATSRVLHVPHVHPNVFDRNYVGESKKYIIQRKINNFKKYRPLVGVILDQTGSCTGSSHPRSYITANPFDAACKITGIATAGLLSKGRGRFYVGMHDLRVHGPDGVLSGKHSAGRL
jgi:hypothetical protein